MMRNFQLSWLSLGFWWILSLLVHLSILFSIFGSCQRCLLYFWKVSRAVTTELNNLQEKVENIEIKSLMNKVRWKKTTGMITVSFEKNSYMTETSRSTLKQNLQNLLNMPFMIEVKFSISLMLYDISNI